MDYIGGIVIVLIFIGLGFLFGRKKGNNRTDNYYDSDFDDRDRFPTDDDYSDNNDSDSYDDNDDGGFDD